VLGTALGEADEGNLLQLVVREVDLEAVPELLEDRLAHLLLLVGDVLGLARLAHAVALDGLGEDEGRLALVLGGGAVGGKDLARIVTAAGQAPDLVVAHVGDQGRRLGITAEEMLADVGAVLRLEILVLAVDAFLHQARQHAGGVALDQRVPARAPQHLDDVPAGPPEIGLEFLDDLAVAAHRAVEALQVAVDDEDEVVEFFTRGQRDGAEALGLVHLAVAHEGPDLAAVRLREVAVVQVAQEARLIDCHQGAEPHGDRGELPEVRHQPGMRIGGQALAVDLLAVAEELLLREAPFEEGAGVDAGRGMALHVDEVAAVLGVVPAPEMHEAGVVESGRRLEARDVAA
jgi:hypothetical protein